MQAQKIIERLDRVKEVKGKHPQNWKACCPAHNDKTPSLEISETAEGKVLLNCWAGCTGQDIVDSLGLSITDLFPYRELQRPHRAPRCKIESDIQELYGDLSTKNVDAIVLDFCAIARAKGEKLSDADLKREMEAFNRSRTA